MRRRRPCLRRIETGLLQNMGISRNSTHKRRSTGGRRLRIRMKRKFEMGRQPTATKIGEKKVTRVRVRGGNFKFRALKLEYGNFAWAGEAVTRKTRILRVAYNSTNNELVRTNTLVKGSIIQIDSTPFKAWYLQFYNNDLAKKKEEGDKKEEKKDDKKQVETKKTIEKKKRDDKKKEEKKKAEEAEVKTKKSKSVKNKISQRNKKRVLEAGLTEQFKTGRLYARITSRPGQSGRADGYVLEGDELSFYQKRMSLKKKK